MIKKTLKYNLLIILILYAFQIQAQQNPQFTQYMYNMSTINPGYATDSGSMNFGALYRAQWIVPSLG